MPCLFGAFKETCNEAERPLPFIGIRESETDPPITFFDLAETPWWMALGLSGLPDEVGQSLKCSEVVLDDKIFATI